MLANEPTARYEVATDGTRVVLEFRSAVGELWSVGALLGDLALRHEGVDIGVIGVPVETILRGATLVQFKVVER